MEIKELNQWIPLPTEALIQHIEDRFHTWLRRNLPDIQQLFEKVANHHGEQNHNLKMAYHFFVEMSEHLLLHLLQEEQVLFPVLLNIAKKSSVADLDELTFPLGAMEEDHDIDKKCMSQIRQLTSNFAVPENACRSYVQLFQALQILFYELELHIAIENEILFKRFRSKG